MQMADRLLCLNDRPRGRNWKLELADENWRKDEKMAARRNEEKTIRAALFGPAVKSDGWLHTANESATGLKRRNDTFGAHLEKGKESAHYSALASCQGVQWVCPQLKKSTEKLIGRSRQGEKTPLLGTREKVKEKDSAHLRWTLTFCRWTDYSLFVQRKWLLLPLWRAEMNSELTGSRQSASHFRAHGCQSTFDPPHFLHSHLFVLAIFSA